jgi:predicted metal-dependent HD superfamily phosphohydrolase
MDGHIDYYLDQVLSKCIGAFSFDQLLGFADFAKKAYESNTELNKVKYHTWSHARSVTLVTEELASGLLPPDERAALTIAALFHDIVYVPEAGASVNESASAQMLSVFAGGSFRLMSGQAKIVDRAVKLILKTSIANHLRPDAATDKLEAILLDADLNTFARPYRYFYRAQRWVRMEAGYGSDTQTCHKHAQFFMSLLGAREHLFHTKPARQYWELRARANIFRWCEEHGVKPSITRTET